MHYYKRNIGDYAKKAARLTILQHGIYNLLIDACYDREEFPSTVDEAIDWVWASSKEEIEGVEFVLKKFFKFDDIECVFYQNRIKEEIESYQDKCSANKRIAINRETKRSKNSTKRKQSANEAPPNQEPITINQEPITNLNQGAWDEWVAYRKVAKLKPYKTNAKAKALAKHSHEIQQMAVNHSIENEYAGLFPERFSQKTEKINAKTTSQNSEKSRFERMLDRNADALGGVIRGRQ